MALLFFFCWVTNYQLHRSEHYVTAGVVGGGGCACPLPPPPKKKKRNKKKKERKTNRNEKETFSNFQVTDWTNPATVAVPGANPQTARLDLAIICPTLSNETPIDEKETRLSSRWNDARVGPSAPDVVQVFHSGMVFGKRLRTVCSRWDLSESCCRVNNSTLAAWPARRHVSVY